MSIKDSYKTLKIASEPSLFKDKNSKFYGYAFPITNEDNVKEHIEILKKQHHAARHWCYAYQLGVNTISYRANDDGEPNNSAGMPIYGQIQSFDLTDTLVIVVRYFGGVKLGVSGLINAYRTAAQLTLDTASIIEKTVDDTFQLNFEYKDMSKVLRILKENDIKILLQKLEMSCLLEISVRKSNSSYIKTIFDNFYGVTIKSL